MLVLRYGLGRCLLSPFVSVFQQEILFLAGPSQRRLRLVRLLAVSLWILLVLDRYRIVLRCRRYLFVSGRLAFSFLCVLYLSGTNIYHITDVYAVILPVRAKFILVYENINRF